METKEVKRSSKTKDQQEKFELAESFLRNKGIFVEPADPVADSPDRIVLPIEIFEKFVGKNPVHTREEFAEIIEKMNYNILKRYRIKDIDEVEMFQEMDTALLKISIWQMTETILSNF